MSKGVPILPFRIEDVAPGKSLDYFIGSVHWLDAMTPPMEKHLDALAATVHKLLLAVTPEPLVHGTSQQAGQQGAQRTPAPTATPVAANRSAHDVATARPSATKTIWIGVAAVAALAVVVTGVMLLRGGGSPHGAVVGPADVTSATNPPAGSNVTSDSNPVSTKSKPSKPTKPGKSSSEIAPSIPPPAVAKSGADPIVGCYQWFNNSPVVIHADGTIVGGPFTGHWRRVNAAQHAYTFTWPEVNDTVPIAPDQRSLSGGNQYGFPTSGTRLSGSGGLVGTWSWPNGVPVTVSPNGTFSAAALQVQA